MPGPEVVIRRGVPTDADAIAAHQTLCWQETYTGLVPSSYLGDPAHATRRRQRWRERLAGEREVWVATRCGAIVGVASAGPTRDPEGTPRLELMTIYVRRLAQERGVGAALLGATIGAAPASVWVFEANSRARGFYERHGFAPDGTAQLDADTGLVEIRMVRP